MASDITCMTVPLTYNSHFILYFVLVVDEGFSSFHWHGELAVSLCTGRENQANRLGDVPWSLYHVPAERWLSVLKRDCFCFTFSSINTGMF